MEPGKTYRTALTIVPRKQALRLPKSWVREEDAGAEAIEENSRLWKDQMQRARDGLDDEDELNEDEDVRMAEQSNLFGVMESELGQEDDGTTPFELTPEEIEQEIDGEALIVEDTDNLVITSSLLDGVFELESYTLQCENASIGIRTSNIMGNVTPLAVEWCGNSAFNNLVAVSSFETGSWGIELYDMDYADKIEPTLVLGGEEAHGKSRGHLGAVLSMSHCISKPNILASAGDRGDIIIWDTVEQTIINRFDGHSGKPIQCLEWQDIDGSGVLASAGFDRTITIMDSNIRRRKGNVSVITAKLSADPEQLCWVDAHHIACAQSNGVVVVYDMRKPETPVMEWSASDVEVTGLLRPHVDGLLVTTSQDGFVRIWDITSGTPTIPIAERDCGHGSPILCAKVVPEERSFLVVGSTEVVCWDLACPTYSEEICRWVQMKSQK